jgi:hypothetical protein
MSKRSGRRPTAGSQASRKILKFTTALAAMTGLLLVGVNPATADEKPTSPQGPKIFGNVDLNGPHMSSDDSNSTKDLGPCSYLISAVTPLGFGWSGEYRWFACSYWGTNSKATKNYQWYVSPGSSSIACAQGYGFKAELVPIWVHLTCGDSGATQVSWGQVAAYPKMKFQSLSGLIVPLYWY